MDKVSKEMLITAVDERAKSVKTKSLDISFNELLDMYNNQELEIDPDYQRMFRWSEEKQSMFIESLILEMPLPPIFVIEQHEGNYELIDGLQRISTYLHFRYKDIDDEIRKEFCSDRINSELVLSGCDIVKELNGYTFDELPRAIQLKLKRNFIRMEVLRKETDKNLRYHMFKRLNTGGELLSNQEVRNCTVRLLGNDFNDFIIECSEYEYFMKAIANVREDYVTTKKDQELVLRYFALKNNLDNYKKDLDFFLTDYMERVTINQLPFDYKREKEIFEKTFRCIDEIYGKNAFSSAINLSEDKFKTDMIMYFYDSFTCGIAKCEEDIENKTIDRMKTALNILRTNVDFLKTRTGGKRNTDERIALVMEAIKNC